VIQYDITNLYPMFQAIRQLFTKAPEVIPVITSVSAGVLGASFMCAKKLTEMRPFTSNETRYNEETHYVVNAK
jgi:hypothetical protein